MSASMVSPHDPGRKPDAPHLPSPTAAPPTGTVASRLRALQEQAEPVLAQVIEELLALAGQHAYTEAAVLHLAAHVGLDLAALPGPLGPSLHQPDDHAGEDLR